MVFILSWLNLELGVDATFQEWIITLKVWLEPSVLPMSFFLQSPLLP